MARYFVKVYIEDVSKEVVRSKWPKSAARKAVKRVIERLQPEGEMEVSGADVYLGDPKSGGEYCGDFDLRDLGLD